MPAYTLMQNGRMDTDLRVIPADIVITPIIVHVDPTTRNVSAGL